ncbi:MAG: sulfite exporter TauE/SafE family protein, partial [Anaerolineales bacterium]|nr:sulfite exporter TauE/SafE family protein [Anaerolineales bacterium]
MDFLVSQISASPLVLALTGFIVGVLGGFFGVGGGFLAGPLMFWIGVPINFVVGSDLAHMAGTSLVATRKHRAFGHVDFRLAGLMIVGTIPGVEIGAQLLERLKDLGNIEQVIGILYILILTAVGLFTAWESLRAIRVQRTDQLDAQEVVGVKSLLYRSPLLRIPPLIRMPVSGIEEISIWAIILVGLVTGILAGLLGVGGGFLRMPLMIYVLGIPTHIAVGTDLFEIVISAGFGTITHSLKGNVDFMIAATMLTGAAFGAQIGAAATRYFSGPIIRLLFSALPIIAAILVLLRLQT